MFSANEVEKDVYINDNYYEVSEIDEVEVDTGVWKRVKDIKVGDTILNSESTYDTISRVEIINNIYRLYV